MDSKERHIKENESVEKREARLERENSVNDDLIAGKLKEDAKNNHNNSTRRINRLWIWFGVLVLIAILLYWIFGIGTVEDLSGVTNG